MTASNPKATFANAIKKPMKVYFCWKCQRELPFLEEQEWAELHPVLSRTLNAVKQLRRNNGSDIPTAISAVQSEALAKFRDITGYEVEQYDVLWHHELAQWGPECSDCGHLLRTPRASRCVNCGAAAKPDA